MNIIDRVIDEANRALSKPRKTKEDMILIIGSIFFFCEYAPIQKGKETEILKKFIPENSIEEAIKDKEMWKANALAIVNMRKR